MLSMLQFFLDACPDVRSNGRRQGHCKRHGVGESAGLCNFSTLSVPPCLWWEFGLLSLQGPSNCRGLFCAGLKFKIGGSAFPSTCVVCLFHACAFPKSVSRVRTAPPSEDRFPASLLSCLHMGWPQRRVNSRVVARPFIDRARSF